MKSLKTIRLTSDYLRFCKVTRLTEKTDRQIRQKDKQADKVTDMSVAGLIHKASVQLTDTLRVYVRIIFGDLTFLIWALTT